MPDTTPNEDNNLDKATQVNPGVKPPTADDSGASDMTKKITAVNPTATPSGDGARSSFIGEEAAKPNGATVGGSGIASVDGSNGLSKSKDGANTKGNPAKNNVDYTGHTLSNRYEIVRLVGQGGMGSLYAGHHVDIKRKVAVKVLHKDFHCSEEVFLRFKQEATLAATLQHQNICSVYDFGRTDDGAPYLIMDLLEGKTLSEILETEKRLTPRRAVRIVAHICEALSHAHSKGIVHRDMKPSNVIVQGEGTAETSKIVDFGIAKSLQEDALRLTATHETIGSPYYMSPEQCQALPIDHRTDIYSLGCVLYELVTGKTPFKASTALQTMYSHVHTEPESFKLVVSDTEIPAMLEEVVFKAMRKDPDDRFQTAEEFKHAAFAAVGAMSHDCLMQEYTNAPSVKNDAVSKPKREVSTIREKSKFKPVVLALGAVALLGLGIYGVMHQEDIALIMDGRIPGEIYNGDDAKPEIWTMPTITNPAVFAVYLGQAHDTPRSKDNDLTIMGHARVRVTNETPDVNLVLLSHAQTDWKIDTAPGAQVRNVILGSTYGKSQVKGIPADRIKYIELEGFNPIGSTDVQKDDSFLALNKKVAEALEKNLPGNGFIIHSLQAAQQLKEFQIYRPKFAFPQKKP
ncbi:MAG: serine/threonine-protein kinase [Candidatus Melainabacteria bacterium]|nr:serine/threonine-protein kinase [Candidatus Melainabacteria bacterium]